MTKLSVNINKVATLRNARGGSVPDVLQVALDCEKWGAQGITVHPRPDERHIRKSDVRELSSAIRTEFNIEGYPSPEFLDLVCQVHPAQVTLVPDAPDALTSNAGWDTCAQKEKLGPIVQRLKREGIRVSIFIEPSEAMAQGAKDLGADRIEMYTEPYAQAYPSDPAAAVAPYVHCAEFCKKIGLGVNAGHDLSLENLAYFAQAVQPLDEVSIGHALICDALYLGLETTISRYRQCLQK
ncbi:MAG: pyridoxine 5'-phosphate synthase [Bacteroidales bacterium]|nr:pyridoxine 5'-phosphate synthase [Bacteroidales bacterium]